VPRLGGTAHEGEIYSKDGRRGQEISSWDVYTIRIALAIFAYPWPFLVARLTEGE
jgi:hypothetical protein